jgi:hypothetical protein
MVRLERHAAAMWVAMSAVLVFSIGGMYLSYRKSIVLALLFVFGTSVYSTGALALWQHTPSVFLIACAIYLLLLAERTPTTAAWCALPLALSYTVRPSDAVLVVVCTSYVWVHHRSQVFKFAMIGGTVAAAFFVMNFSQYGSVLPPYYHARAEMGAPGYWPGVATAAAGLLVSPSRGLFVFTPVFLVAVVNMVRLRWHARPAPWLSVAVAASFIAMLFYLGPLSRPGTWWGGFSYGPRLLTDYAPILALFLIPVFEQWGVMGRKLRIGFATLAMASVLIHVRAGWNAHLISWNWTPISVDVDHARLWDWSDPQFLR